VNSWILVYHLSTRRNDMITKKRNDMITKKMYDRPKYKPSTQGEFSNARVPPTRMAEWLRSLGACITMVVRDENQKYFSIDS
jgi:hypothetical protein